MPLYHARHVVRTFGGQFYQLRIESGVHKNGFLLPLPARIDRDALYNDVIAAAMRWKLLAIAYARRPDGSQYRTCYQAATPQRLKAQGDQLVPLMEMVMARAERGAEQDSHIYDRALVLRAFMKGCPDMRPIMRRHRKELGISDNEIYI